LIAKHERQLWLWSLALTVYAVGQGIVFPAGFSLVLEGRALQAGVASAMIGTIHMTTGGLVAWVTGALSFPQEISLVLVSSAVTATAVLIWVAMKPARLINDDSFLKIIKKYRVFGDAQT
jgi:DHA1 family bicyclomycin/chloramphenicol resistance-like MFS transporter